MKFKKPKDYTISWKEKTQTGFKEKSFDVNKSDVGWHLNNLRKVSDVCYDVKTEICKGV